MIKLKNIIRRLEKKYPQRLKEEWDNVGLILGDSNQEIKKIQLSLDVTEEVIENAIKNKIDLIITHHPMIFGSLKKINNQTILGKKILKLLKNNISVYTLHTNLDSAKEGLNNYIVNKLGIQKSEILVKISEEGNGIGRIFKLSKKVLLLEYIDKIKAKLEIENIRVVYNENQKVQKIGIVNGSGASYIRKMKRAGVDLFITSDIKYHEALDSLEAGLPLVDIGHYESEVFFSDLIKKELPEDIEVEVFNSKPVFKFL
ncbi:MAG: Nif3-like dinuclear metal center hexameric protein [Fusobacteriia bacterium 4572_132]|nr:MAG: Nif3-like dinuclear metal center hexameric protein [Fusobacteriia bacterium 4572_132]